MYLKRIDISGFKSFPDPATVVFNPGITSVVGPNGCGKTNILDALRWVLGEQRPRLLRGGKMEEVIFAGTRQRPPLNAAEVTLTIDNRSGRLPLQYAEISVARRLFRSGESEYLLNNVPCRLKDITTLFADTGFGSHSYSVIGQGMIDSLLSDNPEDRRFLFEEAAGISKYKARRKEALNKLQATDNDLLRVNDIHREVEQRVRALRVQVFRAKRYKKLSDQLAGIEWQVLTGDYRRCREELSELLIEYNRTATNLGQRQTDLAHAETSLEQVRLEVNEADTIAAQKSEALNNAVTKAHQSETELVRNRERRDSATATIKRLSEELTERTTNNEQWSGELENLRRQIGELTRQRDEFGQQLAEFDSRFQAEDTKLSKLREERETLTVRLREGERAYGEYRADRIFRTEQAQTRAADHAELQKLLAGVESELADLTADLEKFHSEKEQQSQRRTSVEHQLNTVEDELTDNDKKKAALADQINQCQVNLSGNRAQIETLAAVVARGEGLGQGIEAVLQRREEFGGGVEAWVQRISAPAEKRVALEAALGATIGSLWCETPEVAARVLAFLADGEVGPAGLWDPSLPIPQARTWDRPPVTAPGFRGWLIDDCQVAADIRPLAEVLLFSVMLADTIEHAREIFCLFSGEYPVVSLDGTAFVPPGMIYTGSGGTSVLGRTEQLAQLEKEVTTEDQRLITLQDEDRQLLVDREQLDKSATDLQREKDRQNELVNTLELNIHQGRTKEIEIIRRQEDLTERRDKVETELAQAQLRRQTVEQDWENWEEQRTQLTTRLQTADGDLEGQETKHRAALNQLNEKRMAGVELSGRVERMSSEIERLTEAVQQNALAVAERSTQKENAQSEHEHLTVQIAEREKIWAELLAEKGKLDTERNAALAVLDKKKDNFNTDEREVRLKRREREEAASIQHRWEMKRAEVSGRLEQLVGRAHEGFQRERAVLEQAADELRSEEVVNQEDIVALKARLERVGPVNLLALEEYESEKERLEFLNSQTSDLQAAKTSLAKTIEELNRTAGERFLANFEAARLNFQSVFSDLFQGGEADVRLSDPDNPLESPIDIYARPRGKKALGIRQLSGGERALTAIAMLFGLYLVKPSPFCILDEVDAPLDDANTTRFLRLLSRFKMKTQFVVITHNKLTMESADTLYGVTMEQPGVSRLVSVRLNPEASEVDRLLVPLPSGRIEIDTAFEDQPAE